MENNEKTLFTNRFGSVTDKRVVLNYKSGTEDIPLGQISSISYQHERNHFFSIGGFVIGGGALLAMISNLRRIGGIEVLIILIVAIVGLLSGIANWIGHHNIIISAGGKERRPIKAELSKTREGRDFVNALKKAVIK
jgi:hypothetical protein